MGANLPERQRWLETALQGLAFWIGHRHSMYRHYPLPEGALVAEACNLIQANLSDSLVLFPECMYRNLVAVGESVAGVGNQARADLVICDSIANGIGRDGNLSGHVRFVLEVKRGGASPQSINEDLSRLHSLLLVSPAGVRAFLVVVAESRAPSRFVKGGKSILGPHAIPGTDGHYRVRRSVKAAASFSGKESAHYVCLIEVFKKGQKASEI